MYAQTQAFRTVRPYLPEKCQNRRSIEILKGRPQQSPGGGRGEDVGVLEFRTFGGPMYVSTRYITTLVANSNNHLRFERDRKQKCL